MAELSGIRCGISAEYFVAAELCRRGFDASVTLKNTPGIDILAVYPETGKATFIQVKAKAQLAKKKSWLLDKKDEKPKPDGFFYAFVNLNSKKYTLPDVYIVPAKVVAKRIKDHQEKYTNGLSMREFHYDDDHDKYFDNWDVLK